MKTLVVVILLLGLACLVPLSSKRPDAIQHVLRLPGGVDSAPKAFMGILVAAAAAVALFSVLKIVSRKKR